MTTIATQPLTLVVNPENPAAIPATLIKRIQALFTEEGFTDVELDQTERTLTLSASKGLLAAFVHVTVGKREKGQAATALALAPPVPQSTEPTIIPSLPIELLTRS